MAELRPHYIDVDLKKNTQYNVPVVTQNDTATHFIIRVTDDGLTDPELLDAYQEITMTSQRPDGESFYLTGTRIPGTNEIEFHLGTDETAFSGSVLASLQFYLVEDASRYTSAQFRYDVKKDLTTNYTPTQREETLVEVVLRDGPGVIQEAREAKQAVDGALVDLEQDKTAAIDRLDEVTEENKTVFRQPVNTFADLATTYPNPEHGTTVRVTGESATYRYSDGSWVKTDEYNPTAIDQVTAQLAEKASKEEARLKADKLELEDASPTLLAAIEGGEGTTFDLLSIPQNGSVTNEKLGAELKDTLTFSMRNILPNGDFSDGLTGWNVVSNTTALAVSDGVLVATANGTNANANFRQDFPNQAGKFYVKLRFRVKNTEATALSIFAGSNEIRFNRGSYLVNQWQEVSLVMEDTAMNRVSFIHRFPSVADATNQTLEVDSVMVINLTEANYAEATAEEVAVLIADFPDSYFSGYQNLYSAKNILKKIAAKSKTHGTSWLTDYGAKGDGVTDDSAAIQRALTAGGVIWVNPGTYRMSKTHVINSNTTLIGFGESTKFILGDSFELTPTLWRTGDDTLPKYHPYFITASNAENIEVQNLVIEGNKNQFVDQIQVGLAIETAKKIRVKNVRISNVNYFPSQAPPRPAGQFRTGWNFASFRSSDIEVDGGIFEYGGYECFRVGDDCDGVVIKNALLRYGWRTVFQILRGSKNVKMSNCRVIQDDFGTNDSHAAITLHASYADSPIKNFLIEKSVIEAKTFIENPNGGNGISCVGNHFENVSIVDTVITSNGNGLSPRVIGNFKMDNCIVNAQQIGVNLTAVNADKVEIKNTKINTPGDFALNIIGTKAISMNIEKNELIASNGVGLRSAYANGDSLSIIKNKIASNGLGIQFGAGTIGILYTDDNEITAATNHCIYISSLVVNKRLSVSDNTFAPALANDGIYTAASVNIANAYINRNVSLSGKHGVRLTGTLGDIFVMQNIARNTTHGIDVPVEVIKEGNVVA